jgi:hypothetical protein
MPYFQNKTSSAPLAVFRILLGLMIFVSIVRFWLKGWIDELYIQPKFFFPFYGFEFIKPLGIYTYLLFAICAASALAVALGYLYRLAATTLFLSFTYIELIDKSTYLNHYYFVSLVCFLLIFLPAHTAFSVDAYRNKNLRAARVPAWCVDCIKLLVFILYFYAGLAKLNSDWLLDALPLKIWLPARNDMPIIGPLFNTSWAPYIFSWFGCFYDLTIVFFLLNNRTRPIALLTVVLFHVMTAVLFPIGMFPYIMIVTSTIFLPASLHEKILGALGRRMKLQNDFLRPTNTFRFRTATNSLVLTGLTVFFSFQLLFPFRYLLYPGELFWTEEGYRFSWRVMLIEKAGYAQFIVKDDSGRAEIINNNSFLTKLQEKMMSTQPDMILQYAHMLRDHYAANGFKSPSVYADVYVTLNGRLSKPFVYPAIDLAKETESFRHKSWITHPTDEIKGF